MKLKNTQNWKFAASPRGIICLPVEHITFLIVSPGLLTVPIRRMGRRPVSRSTKFWEIPGLGALLNKTEKLKGMIILQGNTVLLSLSPSTLFFLILYLLNPYHYHLAGLFCGVYNSSILEISKLYLAGDLLHLWSGSPCESSGKH